MVEEWRVIDGSDGYEVSDLGRVRSWRKHGPGKNKLRTFRLKTPHLNPSTGYLQVGFGHATTKTVHVIVAEAFIGPRPKGEVVNHLDGDKTNNSFHNLEYCSNQRNHIHAVEIGLTPSGEKHRLARLSDLDVAEIRDRKTRGETQVSIADVFGVSFQYVSRLCNNLARVQRIKSA